MLNKSIIMDENQVSVPMKDDAEGNIRLGTIYGFTYQMMPLS